MAKIDRLGWADGIAFLSYGLRIGVRVNQPELMERVPAFLPPGWKPASSPIVDLVYSLRAASSDQSHRIRRFNLLYGGSARLARTLDLDEALDRLENSLTLYVAEAARRRVFVHAGVVGWRGRAIILPGRSYSGKSTLVAALVRAGATYYSDEYAVFDARGRVHPYPRPLSIRENRAERPKRCDPAALGGRTGVKPLPVGLVAVTEYEPGARWRVRQLSPGQAALQLLANTVPARWRAAEALAAFQQVLCGATTLKGKRGEVEPAVDRILGQFDA